jgi:hypothetical protein
LVWRASQPAKSSVETVLGISLDEYIIRKRLRNGLSGAIVFGNSGLDIWWSSLLSLLTNVRSIELAWMNTSSEKDKRN